MSYRSHAMLPQTEASLQHILHHRAQYLQDRLQRHLPRKPFVVGVSGCQGSGKTTLCTTLEYLLKDVPYGLNVVSFSLDDVYLDHNQQQRRAKSDPDNRLVQFRGQPGSHDLDLACETFETLLEDSRPCPIPAYDKSVFGGLGDRIDPTLWQTTQPPVDIILFEGWCLGFKSLPVEEVCEQYRKAKEDGASWTAHPLQHILGLNESLAAYENTIYNYFDIFIHLSPDDLRNVYQWRLEQEHDSIRTRGVGGLNDEAVYTFVDTYMPAYSLYLPRLDSIGFYGFTNTVHPYEGRVRADHGYSGTQRHLRLLLDHDRRVIGQTLIKEHDPQQPLIWADYSRPLLFLVGMVGMAGLMRYSCLGRVLDIAKKAGRRFRTGGMT
ncbi:P-loop containing nucleoside triphosphate hydrolase protein [Phycomyces blakesleeanus]